MSDQPLVRAFRVMPGRQLVNSDGSPRAFSGQCVSPHEQCVELHENITRDCVGDNVPESELLHMQELAAAEPGTPAHALAKARAERIAVKAKGAVLRQALDRARETLAGAMPGTDEHAEAEMAVDYATSDLQEFELEAAREAARI